MDSLNMTIDDYFRHFAHARRVTLVGPLAAAVTADITGGDGGDGDSVNEPCIWVDGGVDHRRGQHIAETVADTDDTADTETTADADTDTATDNTVDADNTETTTDTDNTTDADADNSTDTDNTTDADTTAAAKNTFTHGFSIGDGDSANSALDQYLPTDKDHSDLAYVLRRLPAHFNEVHLRGFLGARRDHELFNLGEVHRFLAAAKSPARAIFDRSVFGYSKGEWTFAAHGVFSLAALEPAVVTLTGACKFPLATATEIAPLTSLGLSNTGFGEITLHARAPVFIFMSTCNSTPNK